MQRFTSQSLESKLGVFGAESFALFTFFGGGGNKEKSKTVFLIPNTFRLVVCFSFRVTMVIRVL